MRKQQIMQQRAKARRELEEMPEAAEVLPVKKPVKKKVKKRGRKDG